MTSPAAAQTLPDLAAFFDVSLDMLCIRDAHFRFVRVNEAWTRTLGHRIDALEGARMLDFIHPEDLRHSEGRMIGIGPDGEIDGFINRYRHADGSYRSLEWRARRVGDYVFGVARDVTERLAAEAEMAAAREAAEAANRAKSDFLANMSHEIRTPLNGVIGVAAALARTPLRDDQREMVSLIERSGAALEGIVSDVLDLSKIEAGRLRLDETPFDLRAELGLVIDVFRLRAEEKGLDFRVVWEPGAEGGLVGDPLRLRQVLTNLLSNAVKFTARGGVSVTVGCAQGHLSISVADTGVGFDALAARQLFQRFSQADGTITRRFGGTGLGLAISRSLVELMGGGISAESEPGVGSTFRFRLPARRAPLGPVAGRGAPETGDLMERLVGRRVLLAEDHPVNRRVVELILAPFGVELTIAEDGRAALERLAVERFDLVLMDMQMPVLDGLAATRELRLREAATGAPRTPVLMLSANAMRQHREEAQAAGADRHVAKPVTAQALLQTMAEELER
ncbi:ATP-binding protein [Phenylobacterium sp.]|uniref:ATP-binding protein n=1 Tax=Phenylobacterium sp. TaxID=1871053 RepID=UPI00199BFCD0|nr:ATP-binding protein [Phenylobacterium sp.]MBC7166665.1 response regulator [Phenylobacterium sp.]